MLNESCKHVVHHLLVGRHAQNTYFEYSVILSEPCSQPQSHEYFVAHWRPNNMGPLTKIGVRDA